MEPSFWSALVVPFQSIHIDLMQPTAQEIHLTNICLDTTSRLVKSVLLKAHTDRISNGVIIGVLRPGRTDNLNVNLTFFPSDKYVRLSIEIDIQGDDKRQSCSVHVSGASSPYQLLMAPPSSSSSSLLDDTIGVTEQNSIPSIAGFSPSGSSGSDSAASPSDDDDDNQGDGDDDDDDLDDQDIERDLPIGSGGQYENDLLAGLAAGEAWGNDSNDSNINGMSLSPEKTSPGRSSSSKKRPRSPPKSPKPISRKNSGSDSSSNKNSMNTMNNWDLDPIGSDLHGSIDQFSSSAGSSSAGSLNSLNSNSNSNNNTNGSSNSGSNSSNSSNSNSSNSNSGGHKEVVGAKRQIAMDDMNDNTNDRSKSTSNKRPKSSSPSSDTKPIPKKSDTSSSSSSSSSSSNTSATKSREQQKSSPKNNNPSNTGPAQLATAFILKTSAVHRNEKWKTMSRGLKIRDIVYGTGVEAKTGSKLKIRYVGKLQNRDGTIFDMNVSKGMRIQLGLQKAIDGLEFGLIGTRQGAVREILVPSVMGYGSKGAPPFIPSNSTLYFYIEILSVRNGIK